MLLTLNSSNSSTIQMPTSLSRFYQEAESATEGLLEKKVLWNIFQNSKENTCARVSFLINCRLWHKCFHVNFAKNFGKPFLQNTSQRLFLNRFSISYISLLNGIFTLSYWSTGENLNYCHLLQSLLDSCKTIFGQVYLQIPRIHLCWIFGLDKLDMYCLRCS